MTSITGAMKRFPAWRNASGRLREPPPTMLLSRLNEAEVIVPCRVGPAPPSRLIFCRCARARQGPADISGINVPQLLP